MNTYTKNLQNNPVPQTDPVREAKPENAFVRGIFLLGCICVIFFCAIALLVFLTARIERMNKTASRIQQQIREYEIQCYHLRNRKAALTTMNHVSSKVREYGLKLRVADYRQIRTVSLLPEKSGLNSTSTRKGISYTRKGTGDGMRYANQLRKHP